MKTILIQHILPLCLAFCFLTTIFFSSDFPKNLSTWSAEKPFKEKTSFPPNYFPVLRNSLKNDELIKNALQSKELIILGSSELTHNSIAVPYRFIPTYMHFPVLGIGHAGFQSLAILSTLSSMSDYLNQANVLVILSPGWFEDYFSRGTSVELFLENINDRMLTEIILSEKLPLRYKQYIANYVASQYSSITRASIPFRHLYHQGASENNLFFMVVHYPFVKFNALLLSLHFSFLPWEKKGKGNLPGSFPQAGIPHVHYNESNLFNWDSILNISLSQALSKSTNNNWGIENDYYTTYIHGRKGHIKPVSTKNNQELKDFGMLVSLLRTFDCNATFVIQPLNPFYFPELSLLKPTLQAVTDTIALAGFPCLNLFESDSTKYNKAILRDVMHMDDYAWHLVNRFINDQYINNE